jgi:PAS domain S-box-containing protein
MQQPGFEVSTASMLAPVLVAGAIVAAFCACHYTTERKHRRDFLRWWAANQPQPPGQVLADPPTSGGHRWTHGSGLYGIGTAALGVRGGADSLGSFLYRQARGYALTILFVSLALVVRSLLDPVLRDRLPYIFFSSAVLFTGIFAGIWETLLALILGFLGAEWFIIEPRSSFMISGTHGWLGAVLYFIIGLGIVWFKRSETAAERQALASDIAHLDRLKELDRERALRAMLTHIVETRAEPTFALTTEDRIMTWNGAAEKLLGYSGKEAADRPLAFIVPPDEQPQAEQILGIVQRGEVARPWQAALQRKDGSRVEVSLAASLARDANGKVVGVSVVAHPRSAA